MKQISQVQSKSRSQLQIKFIPDGGTSPKRDKNLFFAPFIPKTR